MIEELTIESAFDLKQIHKTDWQKYRFDQIAFNISERVEPQETDLEIYVGLEHLDPDSIHIKRWGTPSDVEGTKLKVYPGDVIFGKRRAYQRKAALATFEGICSAHAMVLRPNPEVIEPDLFPFFLHSDAFMHRAVDISVGSLSPTINWKTLAVQEFLLPPKEQQAKLAELLWAADDVVVNTERFKESIELVKQMSEINYLKRGFLPCNFKPSPLGDIPDTWNCLTLNDLIEKGAIVSHLDGNHGEFYPVASDFVDSGVPYLSANCIVDGIIDFSKAKFLSNERASVFKKGVAQDGDVLLAHNATVGPTALLNTDLKKVILSTTLTYYSIILP